MGVDYSPRAIRIAKSKLRHAGIRAPLLVSDLRFPTDLHGRHDLALDIGCFHSMRVRDGYLSNLSAALKTGGHWLLYAFVRAGVGRPVPGLNAEDLDLIASCGFRLLDRTDGLDRPGRPSAWFLFEKLSREA